MPLPAPPRPNPPPRLIPHSAVLLSCSEPSHAQRPPLSFSWLAIGQRVSGPPQTLPCVVQSSEQLTASGGSTVQLTHQPWDVLSGLGPWKPPNRDGPSGPSPSPPPPPLPRKPSLLLGAPGMQNGSSQEGQFPRKWLMVGPLSE